MFRLTVFVVSAIVLSACAGPQSMQTSVAKKYEMAVTLEQQEKSGVASNNYEHPYKMNLYELKQLMADLSYARKSMPVTKSDEKAVFQGEEIDRLAPVLVEALSKAKAGQRVRFVSFSQGKAAIFSESQKTEGVVFVDFGEQLNLAFNYINNKRAPSETSAMYHEFSTTDPLKIKAAKTALSVTAPYVEPHKFADGNRAPMWVVADLNGIRKAVVTPPVPSAKKVSTGLPTAPKQAETANMPFIGSVPAEPAEDRLQKDVKDKLKFLKELQDEGLISEQDYSTKKLELLDKIN